MTKPQEESGEAAWHPSLRPVRTMFGNVSSCQESQRADPEDETTSEVRGKRHGMPASGLPGQFSESSPLPHKQERKDKRSTPEEEGRSAPEKIIQSLKLCPGGHRPASLSSSCPAGCGLSFNLPPGILLSVQKCCTPSSLKTC
ncbi:putative uncharacterized protein LINC02693 isoform X5 [Symphalangus syndactylus]|uniref:putative uncharacterized protein LINC02693 isoform X5 n=1 Tax=Symphalangus syndactylus TaxID=9590 RepID=UPI003005F1D3